MATNVKYYCMAFLKDGTPSVRTFASTKNVENNDEKYITDLKNKVMSMANNEEVSIVDIINSEEYNLYVNGDGTNIYVRDMETGIPKIYVPPEPTKEELQAQALSQLDKYQPSKSTINSYKNSYKHCLPLHKMPLKSIKYYHLQQVIDDTKRKGLSYSSCKKIRSLISLMFKYGIIMEYCNKNYANLLNLGKNKAVRPHKPFTRQKINKLWANLNIDGIDTILILIYTGMRVGELLNLTKDNVYMRQKYIKITKSKTESGIRIIPIHDKIFPLITKRMNIPGKYLISDNNESPYNYSKYRTLWNKIMQQINAKHSTHDCRHTCATLMDNAEVNFNAKRRILGHSNGDVTDTVYTHKNLKQLRKAINKIK